MTTHDRVCALVGEAMLSVNDARRVMLLEPEMRDWMLGLLERNLRERELWAENARFCSAAGIP